MLLAAKGLSHDDPPKTDLDRLQGAWLSVSIVSDGKVILDEKSPPKEGPVTKLEYKGDKWLIKAGDKVFATGVVKINSNKKPKEIDILDESGSKNEQTKLGIFEIDGDTYKSCLAPAGKPRPTEFISKEGSGHSLVISKRAKP